jgi:hypothetical protein
MVIEVKKTKVKDVQWFYLFSEGVLSTIFVLLKIKGKTDFCIDADNLIEIIR